MAVTTDIVRTWRGPQALYRDLLARPRHEGRVLSYLVVACLIFVISRLPVLARDAQLGGTSFELGVTYTIFAWLAIAPLLFYLIAMGIHGLLALLGRAPGGYEVRLTFFWALLAASPLALLWGLTAAFVGPGTALNLVGLGWCAALVWFVIRGLGTARGAA